MDKIRIAHSYDLGSKIITLEYEDGTKDVFGENDADLYLTHTGRIGDVIAMGWSYTLNPEDLREPTF